MKDKFLILSIALLSCAAPSLGQLRLPAFEVALKGGYMFIDDMAAERIVKRDALYETLTGQGEISLLFGQHIALGYYYQRGIIVSDYHGSDGSSGSLDQDASHLLKGINLRFSTGRSGKFRPYIQAKYSWYEVVVHYDGFNIAGSGNTIAMGAGVMLRVGHKFYLNLLEADIHKITSVSELMFNKNDMFPQVKTGVTYAFSRRK